MHSLGLKSDGTIVAWGDNDYGQCDVPAPNADFVAVAAGWWHSLGLKSDGTIVAWGLNGYGQCNVPAPNADFVAIAGGGMWSLGLRRPLDSAAGDPGPAGTPSAAGLTILSLVPNPFNPTAILSFELERSDQVSLEVHDVMGRRVTTLPLGQLESGPHQFRWDGRDAGGANLASGVYFMRLRGAAGESNTVKAVLLR